MEDLIYKLLTEIGEDPKREGLLNTPKRVSTSLKYLTSGYKEDPVDILKKAIFIEEYDEMVIVRDIEIFSLCEHHLLPFFGKCHVAYLPDKKIVGLSKIIRIVNIYARRLQVQERLTREIANTIQDVLQPRGVGVVIEALHLCMAMRGVEKQSPNVITSAMLGLFRKNSRTRMEFINLITKS